jgi:hypothetical protein
MYNPWYTFAEFDLMTYKLSNPLEIKQEFTAGAKSNFLHLISFRVKS